MRIGLHDIARSAATGGQVPGWDDANGLWAPRDAVLGLTSDDASVTITDNGDGTLDLAAAGGGTGIVESIVEGTGITVDDTDPANPIVSATGGGGGGSGSSGFTQLRKSATQNVATNSWTAITWDIEDYDTLGIHDNVTNNSRLTAVTAGIMKVSAHVGFEGGGGQQYLSFYINGVQQMGWAVGIAASPYVLTLSREFVVAAGDYVQAFIYTGAGTLILYKDMVGKISGSMLTARMVGTV